MVVPAIIKVMLNNTKKSTWLNLLRRSGRSEVIFSLWEEAQIIDHAKSLQENAKIARERNIT